MKSAIKIALPFIFCAGLIVFNGCSITGNNTADSGKNLQSQDTMQTKASDYTTALKNAVLFYDANKCGTQVAVDNYFSAWRGNCHTSDGSDKGVDLTGGFHDAGDHVKFGLPQGYAAAVLGWALYEYDSVFSSVGNKTKLLSTLKYFTDYFLKSHPNANTFYYQVGDGDADHTYWGPPELQTGSRPTLYTATASTPASDVCGETSAALSLMYLNYKSIDSAYAARCLTAAKELYALGKNYLGKSSGQSFYQAQSFYDDLAWAAVWLYVIEGGSSYLTEISNYLTYPGANNGNPWQNKWTMCWDDVYQAVFCKMAQLTGEQKYKDAMVYNLNYWMNSLTKTPGGLRYLNNWGVLRYAAAESMIALLYYRQTGDAAYKTFAQSQMDYILSSNPANMSYMIGYGSTWPLHPHHRAANGYTYANGDNAKPAQHVLTGAVVGGPDQSDKFIDDVNQYQYTEVAIDYNAGVVGALAGMLNNTPISSSSSSTAVSSSRSSVASSVAVSSSRSSVASSVAVSSSRSSVASSIAVSSSRSSVASSVAVSSSRSSVASSVAVSSSRAASSVASSIASSAAVSSAASSISGGYAVNYTVNNDWGAGATCTVTIKNNSAAAVNGWTLVWTFAGNQAITQIWNAAQTTSGATVTVKNLAYNNIIGANGGTQAFGFNLSYSGANAKPAVFTLNGTACTLY